MSCRIEHHVDDFCISIPLNEQISNFLLTVFPVLPWAPVVNNVAPSSLTSSLEPIATTKLVFINIFTVVRLQNFRVPMQRSETWWNPLTF